MFHVTVVREIYEAPNAYSRLSKYIMNVDKCDDYIGAFGGFTMYPDDMILAMNEVYKRRATTEEMSCLFHVVVSLKDLFHIKTLDNMYNFASNLSALIGTTHQNAFALHFKNDTKANYNDSPHIHFMINAVSWRDGSFTEANDQGWKAIYRFVSNNIPLAIYITNPNVYSYPITNYHQS